MKNKTYILWSFAVILAALFWSLDWTLIRPQFYHFPALNIVFLEHLLWALVLSPFLFLWFKKLKGLDKKTIFSLIWVCIFWGLIWTLCITEAFFSAFRWDSSISVIVILQKLQPVFALFLASIILKEKLSKRFYIFAAIAIISAYIIAFPDLKIDVSNGIWNMPAFYALLAAFSFWSSTVFWKDLVSKLWFKLSTALRFTITSILAFFVLLIFGNITTISQLGAIHRWLLVIIVFTSWAMAMFLYYYWLKRIPASKATIFELAWPLSAIFFDFIFNQKMLTFTQIIFSTILLFSFFIIIAEKNKNKD